MKSTLLVSLVLALLLAACGPQPAQPSAPETINLNEIQLPDGFVFQDSTVVEIPEDAVIVMAGSGVALAAPEPTLITKVVGVVGLAYLVWMFVGANQEVIDQAVSGLASGTYQIYQNASEWVASLQSLPAQQTFAEYYTASTMAYQKLAGTTSVAGATLGLYELDGNCGNWIHPPGGPEFSALLSNKPCAETKAEDIEERQIQHLARTLKVAEDVIRAAFEFLLGG